MTETENRRKADMWYVSLSSFLTFLKVNEMDYERQHQYKDKLWNHLT